MTAVIVERYAKAAFDLADEDKAVNSLESSVNWLLEILGKVSADITQNPEFIKKLAEHSKSLYPAMESFLKLIATNNRISYLGEILARINEKIIQNRGELRVSLISSSPISDSDENKLKSAIQDRFKGDSQQKNLKIVLDVNVDKTLIAGAILTIGTRRIDVSLDSELILLSQHLKKQAFPG